MPCCERAVRGGFQAAFRRLGLLALYTRLLLCDDGVRWTATVRAVPGQTKDLVPAWLADLWIRTQGKTWPTKGGDMENSSAPCLKMVFHFQHCALRNTWRCFRRPVGAGRYHYVIGKLAIFATH